MSRTHGRGGDVFLTKANHYVTQSEAREIRAGPLSRESTVFAKIGAAIALSRANVSEPSLVDNNVMGFTRRRANLITNSSFTSFAHKA